MEYIVTKRFKGIGIEGAFNLPYGTVCPCVDSVIIAPDGRCVCFEHSENGWTYFRPNTEEGRRRRSMLDRLYRYYEKGKGDFWKDFDPRAWQGAENTYWKNLLRTMPTDKLTAFYRKRLGEPNFQEV